MRRTDRIKARRGAQADAVGIEPDTGHPPLFAQDDGPHRPLQHDDDIGAVVGQALAGIKDRAEQQQFLAGEAVLDFDRPARSEEHTSELQSLMRISYAVFCLKKKKYNK